MAGNIVDHGFRKDRKRHSVDVRVVHKGDDVILRLKDDCVPFNPGERRKLAEGEDGMRNMGIRMAIDDYGTGYSNLANLMSNNYRTVKIDKSLLWKATDKAGLDFLMITVNQLKSIKLQVLQEGVETKEQLDIITSFGGNLIQGYYFSKPLPAGEFIAYCKRLAG